MQSFAPYLARWRLEPDGAPIVTWGARLLPVRHGGEAAMLKIAVNDEEKFGGLLMQWWNGDGAARVFEADEAAILLERAQGTRSLADWARGGRDDEATVVLCDAVAALHAPRPQRPPEGLVPLPIWFRDLEPAAQAQGGVLARAHDIANQLFATAEDEVVLHGDVHHDNVLDFGARGWLAIDPKRIRGERGFDYANIFTNPDLGDPTRPVAIRPGQFVRRLDLVLARSGLERRRLLQWIVAWCGLSAAWFLQDDDDAFTDFAIAEQALALLDA